MSQNNKPFVYSQFFQETYLFCPSHSYQNTLYSLPDLIQSDYLHNDWHGSYNKQTSANSQSIYEALRYQKTPYRIKLYFQEKKLDKTIPGEEGEDPTTITAEKQNAAADKFAPTLDILAADRWDYLAIPTIRTEQLESVGAWLKTNRENKFKRSKVVLPGYPGDYEGSDHEHIIIDIGLSPQNKVTVY